MARAQVILCGIYDGLIESLKMSDRTQTVSTRSRIVSSGQHNPSLTEWTDLDRVTVNAREIAQTIPSRGHRVVGIGGKDGLE